MTDNTVALYNELPDHRFIGGPAVQFVAPQPEDGLKAAVAIAEWLAELNVVSYVSPPQRGAAATILIPNLESTSMMTRGRPIVFPSDWVLVDATSGKAYIFGDMEFGARFLKNGDPLPGYLSYDFNAS